MDLMKADEIYRQKLKENPQFDHDMIMMFREEMPEEFAEVMQVCAYGKHLDEDTYNRAIALLENKDGTQGAKWSVDSIREKSGMDFDSKNYTLYDFAYVVNAMYSDYSSVFTEPSFYLKMARLYLEDVDYYGDPSERAFCDAKERIKYFRVEE